MLGIIKVLMYNKRRHKLDINQSMLYMYIVCTIIIILCVFVLTMIEYYYVVNSRYYCNLNTVLRCTKMFVFLTRTTCTCPWMFGLYFGLNF